MAGIKPEEEINKEEAPNHGLDVKALEISDTENLRERRYLWTARAFTVVFVVSLCANIVLILAIKNMIPLSRVEPFMLTFQNKNEQIINIEPITNIPDKDLITESLIRQYVTQRNTMTSDLEDMTTRWGPEGPVKWMSSDIVYTDFYSKTGAEALEQIRTKGLTREIEIFSVNKLSKDVWQAEIETRDMVPEAEAPTVSRWTILLRVDYFLNSRVKYSLRLKNPLGFTVREYSIKPSSN
ncbi:MAG: hypothetical protein IKD08_03220 [Alphaproteobacteria bacterium]|nr:hypothetical protein [Alphaproteobacteria bacterium]